MDNIESLTPLRKYKFQEDVNVPAVSWDLLVEVFLHWRALCEHDNDSK